MNKKLVFVTILTILIMLLFTSEVALAWVYNYRYRTTRDYKRCLGIRCDRTENIVFRSPRVTTPSFRVRYDWRSPWRRRPTTCYRFVYE